MINKPQLYTVLNVNKFMSKNNFISDIIKTFGVQFFILALNIIQSVIINRSLIPADKGVYAIIIQSVNIIIAFGQFGQPEVMLYFISKNKNNMSKYLINIFVLVFVTLFISLFIVGVSYDRIDILKSFNNKNVLFIVLLLIIVINLINIFYQRLIQLSGDLYNYNRLLLLQDFTRVLAIIIMIYFIEDNIFAIISGLCIGTIISFILTAFHIVRNINFDIKLKFDINLFKSSIREGLKLQIGLVATVICTQLGIFILASRLDSESAGLYSVSLGLVNMFLIIPNTIKIVFQSWISNKENSEQNIIDKTALLFKHCLLILSLCSIFMVVFGKHIILLLYGSLYVPSYGSMTILLIYLFFRGLGSCFGTYIALKKTLLVCFKNSFNCCFD